MFDLICQNPGLGNLLATIFKVSTITDGRVLVQQLIPSHTVIATVIHE